MFFSLKCPSYSSFLTFMKQYFQTDDCFVIPFQNNRFQYNGKTLYFFSPYLIFENTPNRNEYPPRRRSSYTRFSRMPSSRLCLSRRMQSALQSIGKTPHRSSPHPFSHLSVKKRFPYVETFCPDDPGKITKILLVPTNSSSR